MAHDLDRKEQEEQQQSERLAHLRDMSSRLADKNAKLHERETGLLSTRERERNEYIRKLRSQAAKVYASRKELFASLDAGQNEELLLGTDVAKRIEALEGALNTLVHNDTLEMRRVAEKHGFFEHVRRAYTDLMTVVHPSDA